MFSLSNSFLRVEIAAKGAELCSVKSNGGVEYLWQASEAVWARHAPVLFPIVGKLKNNTYYFENTSYELPQHGFARDMMFDAVQTSETEIVFTLTSTAQTQQNYPFQFLFKISYRLNNNSIVVNYTVKNADTKALYYSVGAHPGFNCPLLPNEKFSDYYLQFERSEFEITLLQEGLLSQSKKPLVVQKGVLPLNHTLFDNDALIFEGNQINAVELCSTSNKHKVRIECKNWPYFGIWSKKGSSNFVCLEPWYGIADSFGTDQQFIGKKGIQCLQLGQIAEHSFEMSFF